MPFIYKTPDGAVLKNPDGKLIKEPYNFGNAFTNRIGLNNYIAINNLNLTQFNQTLFWVYYPAGWGVSGEVTPYYNLKNTNNDNFIITFWEYGGGWLYCCKNSTSTNIVAGSIQPGDVAGCRLFSLTLRNSLYNTMKLNKLTLNYASGQSNNYPITSIWLGAIRNEFGSDPNSFINNNKRLGRFIFFNREISTSEYLFYFNNSSGNNPQSTLGLEIDLHCNFAEILDFSPLQNGSDMRVGCRDYSGYNRHGEIMNLPAGTLQQKLDFANANLFVPFQ